MWLESVRNWINEILGTTTNPHASGQYVDVGVQTNGTSAWATIKQWLLEVWSTRSSEIESIGNRKVAKWIDKLESAAQPQDVLLHDSEGSLPKIEFGSPDNLQNLVGPGDSVSQVSEVVLENNVVAASDHLVHNITESNLDNPVNRIYDTS